MEMNQLFWFSRLHKNGYWYIYHGIEFHKPGLDLVLVFLTRGVPFASPEWKKFCTMTKKKIETFSLSNKEWLANIATAVLRIRNKPVTCIEL